MAETSSQSVTKLLVYYPLLVLLLDNPVVKVIRRTFEHRRAADR